MTEQFEAGLALFREGKPDEAILFFEDVASEEIILASYYLTLCHSRTGRYDRALESLELVLAGEGNLLRVLQARILKGWILTRMGKITEALAWFEILINDGIESAQVYSAYGWLLAQTGRKKEAVSFLNRALMMDPDNPNTLNTLGYVLAELGIYLAKALKLCRKALSRNPDNALYLDSLAWVYYKMGQYRLAKVSVTKALAKAGHALLREHLRLIEEKLVAERGKP